MANSEFTPVHNDDLAALLALTAKLSLLHELYEQQLDELETTLHNIQQRKPSSDPLYSST